MEFGEVSSVKLDSLTTRVCSRVFLKHLILGAFKNF